MVSRTLLCWAFLLVVPAAVHADESASHRHSHEKHPRCPDPTTFREVIECLTQRHNSVQVSEKAGNAVTANVSAAAQWANPNLQIQGLKGSDAGSYQIQAALLFEPPFISGKSARVRTAEAAAERARASHDLLKSEIKIDGILKLVRLRQILRELEINERTNQTLSKALGTLRARGRLTPELETTASIFTFASHEATIAKSFLMDERREIGHFFEIHTGLSFEQLEKVLRPENKTWPAVEKDAAYQAVSASSRALKAERNVSEGLLAQQKSWFGSNFLLGPMFEREKDSFRNESRYGLQLNLPLPVFNLNGGGKAQAAAEAARAETSLALSRTTEEHERLEQSESYELAVQTLKGLPSQEDLDRRLDRGFTQYQRGLVNAPHLMELYRQAIDFLKARHERERLALRSLWTVYQIDNRSLEENL